MLRDAEHFKARIGSLEGAGDAGDYIVNLVKGKSVPVAKAATAPEPVPATMNGKTSSGNAVEPKAGEKLEVKEETKVENENP